MSQHMPWENHDSKKSCVPSVHCSTIARTWKQPRCPSTDEWIKMWHMYTMKYYSSNKKEQIWVSWTEGDKFRAFYTEWGKSEREKQILYINTYVWNLEK